MSEKQQNIFVIIGQRLRPDMKKFVWGLISTMAIGAISLSFAFIRATSKTNQDFPEEKKKSTEVEQKANSLRIDVEVMKKDVSNVVQSVSDIKEEQKSQRNILIQILSNSKTIKENTK